MKKHEKRKNIILARFAKNSSSTLARAFAELISHGKRVNSLLTIYFEVEVCVRKTSKFRKARTMMENIELTAGTELRSLSHVVVMTTIY